MDRLTRIIKEYFSIIVTIGILILLNLMQLESDYFKSDIENYQNSVKQYNISIACTFLIIATVYIIFYVFTKRFKIKSKPDKKDFIGKSFFYAIFLTFGILISIDGAITKTALFINKQKSDSSIVRDYKFGSFDYELNKLTILDKGFDEIDMNKTTYNMIKNDSVVQVRFKIGVFSIPFDPIHESSKSN
jgi:hypothetical protein